MYKSIINKVLKIVKIFFFEFSKNGLFSFLVINTIATNPIPNHINRVTQKNIISVDNTSLLFAIIRQINRKSVVESLFSILSLLNLVKCFFKSILLNLNLNTVDI